MSIGRLNPDAHGAMVVLNMEQGSAAWTRARLGIPTASNFKRIMTATGTLSNASVQYMNELINEWRTAKKPASGATEWMRRGLEMEPEARAFYARRSGVSVAEVGLVYRDERRLIAASPDGMVGDDGLLEIKCPKHSTHEAYLRAGKIPPAYIPQVQGQLWVTNRKWCDFFSYHPDFPEQLLLRVARDERYIKELCAAVEGFVSVMLERRRLFKRRDFRGTTSALKAKAASGA